MIHTIRQHGQLTQIDCELGSGFFDKNGKEICEGDKVKIWQGIRTDISPVVFTHAGFYAACMPIAAFPPNTIEVIGHVAED